MSATNNNYLYSTLTNRVSQVLPIILYTLKLSDLVQFVMCILVSRDCVPFCKYIKRPIMCTLGSRDCVPFCEYIEHYVYPENQGTHDKLYQIHNLSECSTSMANFFCRYKTINYHFVGFFVKSYLYLVILNVHYGTVELP